MLRERSFLSRFWTLFNEGDEQANCLIGWSKDGKYFYIFDTSRDREHLTRLAIERGILQRACNGKGRAMRKTPKYDNISRQLRYYGFNRGQSLDRGRIIAWKHPHLNRDSTAAEVKRWKSNAPSKSKQRAKSSKNEQLPCREEEAQDCDEDEEGRKEYCHLRESLIQCPEEPTLLKKISSKPMTVDSGIEEKAKKAPRIIFGASMVTFDKPLQFYDLENFEEEMVILASESVETVSVEVSVLCSGSTSIGEQTPSPTLAPAIDWKAFDVEIAED